jgi:retron-type reverse transcriptase
MSLQTPEKIRNLQKKLYVKAKTEPDYRFYLLYDKVWRADILDHAYRLARANGGTAGVDGVTFAAIAAAGEKEWLAGLGKMLRERTYRPDPVRRVMIPKPNGGERPLGIPTIRDRVVQTAVKRVIEPIFEVDLEPNTYGYRPRRSAGDAIKAVHGGLRSGYTDVVDADLSKYLDPVSYCTLVHETWLKRSGCEQLSLRRRPFLRPRLTWMASISPRLTRCHTVCRETPSRRMAWYMVRYPRKWIGMTVRDSQESAQSCWSVHVVALYAQGPCFARRMYDGL